MTWSYNAGSTSPGFGGLAEFTSLRINDGTFKPIAVPPLTQTPPPRFKVDPVPRGGGSLSTVSLDAWEFNLDGYFDVNDSDNAQDAIEYLKAKVNTFKGELVLTLNARGWAATRTLNVYVAGPIVVEEPEVERKKIPRRTFSIPLLAPDPVQYSSAQATTSITTSTAVTNAGNANVPYTVHFAGPNTSYIQVDSAGNRVRLDYAVPSGKYVEIFTRDGLIITDTGVDLYQYVTIDSGARYLIPGTNSFNKTSGSGGTASIIHYDGWV